MSDEIESERDGIALPKWATHTLSAVAGAGIVLVTATLFISSVHHTSSAALKNSNHNSHNIEAEIRPRLRVLENQSAEVRSTLTSIDRTLIRLEELIKPLKDKP